ncbi:MAG: adenylate kinase [Bacteroidales bacterium]|jgi:adenylate kinase|nr:adenylate kinase [Bacteroidales bacterium]
MNNRHLFNIVLLGAPGCGKGTQAALIQKEYGLTHISTGAMFRHEISARTPIGLEADKAISRGNYCSDELTLDLLNQRITQASEARGFILDGVPRTIEQALKMDGIHYQKPITISLVICLKVDDAEIIKRVLQRAKIENRADDTLEIVKQRISNYYTLTEPLMTYYEMQHKLCIINGMQHTGKVFADIETAIQECDFSKE